MVNKADRSLGLAEAAKALAIWVQAGESLLSDLSSIFNELSPERGIGGLSAEVAQRLWNIPLNPQALKNFREYSVRLLSSLEKIAPRETKPLLSPKKEEALDLGLQKQITPSQELFLGKDEQKMAESEVKNREARLNHKHSSHSSIKQTPSDSVFTLPLPMQKMIGEVLHSIDQLSAVPKEGRERILQFGKAYEKIKSMMEQFIKSTQGAQGNTDLSKSDESSVKIAVKKSSSKELSLPIVHKNDLEKKALENWISRVAFSEVKPLTKTESDREGPLPSSKKGQYVLPSLSVLERTILPGAPFTPPISLSNASRKEKKRRKMPWEREEHDRDEPRERS